MGNQKAYITLVIIGGLIAVSGMLMKFSANPSLRGPGVVLGWCGIGILIVARVVFGRKRRT